MQQTITAKYTSEDDRLFIEDKTVRMPIVGSDILNPQYMVTGVVLCLKGVLNDRGELEVRDYILPGPPMGMSFAPSNEEKYLAFVSGLEIAEANVNHNALLLLKDFISGNTPLANISKRITRLIVAGNGVSNCDVKSLGDCDIFLSQLASCVHVDLMPGRNTARATASHHRQAALTPLIATYHSNQYYPASSNTASATAHSSQPPIRTSSA